MNDFIVRGITKDGYIKAVAIQSTQLVEKAREIHKTLPLATAALGRTLTAASMMGDELKEDTGSVTLQIRGGGPLGAITAVSDSSGNVRGYLQNPGMCAGPCGSHPAAGSRCPQRGQNRFFSGGGFQGRRSRLAGRSRP